MPSAELHKISEARLPSQLAAQTAPVRLTAAITNGVGPLEHTLLDPFRNSFSAGSTPIFKINGAFFSIFQALHVFLCTFPDFSDFSGPLHHLWQHSTQFLLIF
jgi:hypothetical protein